MTELELQEHERKAYDTTSKALAAEVRRCHKQITDLQNENNRQVDLRRVHEIALAYKNGMNTATLTAMCTYIALTREYEGLLGRIVREELAPPFMLEAIQKSLEGGPRGVKDDVTLGKVATLIWPYAREAAEKLSGGADERSTFPVPITVLAEIAATIQAVPLPTDCRDDIIREQRKLIDRLYQPLNPTEKENHAESSETGTAGSGTGSADGAAAAGAAEDRADAGGTEGDGREAAAGNRIHGTLDRTLDVRSSR